MPGRSTSLGRGALFVLGLGLSCVLAEAWFRLVELPPLWRVLPVVQISLYGPDPDTGYRLRAGASGIWATESRTRVRINSLGLRDGPMALEKPPGVVRIALLGDSITEALQVDLDKTFQAVAEERLNAGAGRGTEIVNLGMSGATPAVSLERLSSLGVRFDPSLAVLVHYASAFVSPSFGDDRRFPAYVPGDDGRTVLSHGFREQAAYRFRQSRLGALVYGLIDNVRLFGALNARKNAGLIMLPQLPAARDRVPADGAVAGGSCTSDAFDTQMRLWRDGEPRAANSRLTAFLDDLSRLSKSRELPVVLALIGLAPGCAEKAVARTELMRRIDGRLGPLGIAWVDLSSELRKRLPRGVSSSRLYGFGARIGYGHFNELGHRIMGQVLSDTIRAQLDRKRGQAASISRLRR